MDFLGHGCRPYIGGRRIRIFSFSNQIWLVKIYFEILKIRNLFKIQN